MNIGEVGTSMIFLQNGKNLLEPTKPVVMSYRFMQALFEIEKNYMDKDEKFRFRTNGNGRLMNHLTKADLQLATTLQVCFATDGKLEFVNKHLIYKKLKELYERGCNKDQFYAAFDKLVLHGLIIQKKDEYTGDYHFTLQHYIEPHSGKIGRLVLMHPIIFSSAFTHRQLSDQKLFYYAVLQQGNPKIALEWNLTDGLNKFTHLQEVYQTKQLLSRMVKNSLIKSLPPLFSSTSVVPNALGGYKAVFSVSKEYLIEYKPGTGSYHEVIPARKGHRRLIKMMKDRLLQLGIGEFEIFKNGSCFLQLASLLKKKGEVYIRYVLTRIKELHQEYGIFPEHIIPYIKDELRSKAMIIMLDIAKKTDVFDYIAADKAEDKQRRLYEFSEAMSGLSSDAFRRLCKETAPILRKKFSKPPEWYKPLYAKVHWLEEYLDIEMLRSWAWSKEKDPESYRALETVAWTKIRNNESKLKVRNWLLHEIESLSTRRPVPELPIGFKLEQWLLQQLNKSV